MPSRKLQFIAGIVSLAYILIQSFQWWVFAKVPEGSETTERLLSGAHYLNIYRSSLMLIAIYGLLFIYFTICLVAYKRNKALSVLAFLGFLVFFLMEIGLRSVELFYIQLQLPRAYLAAQDTAIKAGLLQTFETFQQIQHALYFPLMFSPMIGSVILAIVIPATRLNWIIKSVFIINAVRLALRILAEYLGIDILGERFMTVSYLPLVYLLFGLTAWWLFRVAQQDEPLQST